MAVFCMPEYIFTGDKALEEAGAQLGKLGSNAFIVTGRHVGKSEMMNKLLSVLKLNQIVYHVFCGITGEPTDRMVMEGVKAYKENNCDFVIGIGGGSPLDAAKAIALMSLFEQDKKISDFMGIDISEDGIPAVAAIPTTAGTGSEATKFTIVTDEVTNVKMLLKGNCLIPRVAVVQKGFTNGMPRSVVAATGLDALTHAVEAFISKRATPLTDVLAVSAIKRIMKYLPLAYQEENNQDANEQMALAALEAGICINNSSVTIVHGMSRPIGALFHVPHGLSNAMLLKECLYFAADETYDRFAALAGAVGLEEEEDFVKQTYCFLKALEELCEICHVPTLQEYGIERKKFRDCMEKMAEDAIASGSPSNTRKTVTKEDCIRIYEEVIGK